VDNREALSQKYRVLENVTTEIHERLRQRPILTISGFEPPRTIVAPLFSPGATATPACPPMPVRIEAVMLGFVPQPNLLWGNQSTATHSGMVAVPWYSTQHAPDPCRNGPLSGPEPPSIRVKPTADPQIPLALLATPLVSFIVSTFEAGAAAAGVPVGGCPADRDIW